MSEVTGSGGARQRHGSATPGPARDAAHVSAAVHHISVEGARLYYVERGRGRPLILVHGSLSDYRYWVAQMDPMSEHYRVIAVSLPHHYPDASAADARRYGVRQHAYDLCCLIESVGESAHVVAHSRGAHVAVLAALRRPELFRSLVLADPAIPLPHGPETGSAGADRRLALGCIRAGDIDGGLELFIDAVSGAGVWRRLNSRRRQMARDNARTLLAQYDDAEAAQPVTGLDALTLPVLLISGEKSPAPYPAIAEALQAVLPNVSRVTMMNASHAMNAEDPAGFNQRLVAFLGNMGED